MADRLYRSENDQVLAGVCGGIAEVYNLDPTLVRLGMVLFGLVSAGTAILIYVIAALIIPPERQVRREAQEIESIEEFTEEDTFECDECGESFDSERGLKIHKGQKH